MKFVQLSAFLMPAQFLIFLNGDSYLKGNFGFKMAFQIYINNFWIICYFKLAMPLFLSISLDNWELAIYYLIPIKRIEHSEQYILMVAISGVQSQARLLRFAHCGVQMCPYLSKLQENITLQNW